MPEGQKYQLYFKPEEIEEKIFRAVFSKKSGIPFSELGQLVIERRSIDARRGQPKYQLVISHYPKGEELVREEYEPSMQNVINSKEVLIVGAGPAGLFAAIECIASGLKPIVLDRGKEVRARRRDLALITRSGKVDPDSNYCFGAGGAGTFSDGKLYTRSHKRGKIKKVLETLVFFGAPESILIDAHPHIGTNKLPPIIEAMISFIREAGGEVRFNTRLEDLEINSERIRKIICNNGLSFAEMPLILATGHSARDIYRLLHKRNIRMEKKGLAIGLRIEHPQEFVDKIQYRCKVRNPLLPPASYALVAKVNGRGVYSFCMCPGGIIAPCATAEEEVVTNGWSPSKRNNALANSGIVVELREDDFQESVLSAMDYQIAIEKRSWQLGGKNLHAPAQRLPDFMRGNQSPDLPKSSYLPGTNSVDLAAVFPKLINDNLKEAFKDFNRKMKGYISEEALLVAPETRTSAPLRIPRDNLTREHPEISQLFPCGEGAGYAGGIVSAALDGFNTVKAIARNL